MSRLDHVRCDGCGKDVPEGKNIGWISITLSEDYCIEMILDYGKDGNYTTDQLATDQLDFCTPECAGKWFKKAVKAV